MAESWISVNSGEAPSPPALPSAAASNPVESVDERVARQRIRIDLLKEELAQAKTEDAVRDAQKELSNATAFAEEIPKNRGTRIAAETKGGDWQKVNLATSSAGPQASSDGWVNINQEAAKKPEPKTERGEFMKGLIGGMVSANPKMLGAAAKGVGTMTGWEWLKSQGDRLAALGEENAKGYEPAVGSVANVRTDSVTNTLGDFFTKYLPYQTGNALASMAPTIASGLLGAAGGGAVAGPAGATVGGAAGIALTGYPMNYGDIYSDALDDKGIKQAVKDGRLTDEDVARVTALAAVPITALDSWSMGRLGAALTKDIKAGLYKRIFSEMAAGGLREGTTEGLQQIISEAVQHSIGSDKTMKEHAVAVVDNAIGGLMGGAVTGGGAGAMQGAKGAPPAPAPSAAPEAPPVAPPAPDAGIPFTQEAVDLGRAEGAYNTTRAAEEARNIRDLEPGLPFETVPTLSPLEQARVDAQALKAGEAIPSGDQDRHDNAKLIAIYGENAAVHKVIEHPELTGGLKQAMLDAAPTVERVRTKLATNEQSRDITSDIVNAVDELAQIRASGKTVAQVMAHGHPGDASFEAHQLMQFLDDNLDNPQRLAEFMESYLHVVETMGGVPSTVRGQAFDIIQERNAARKLTEEARLKEAKDKAFAEAERDAKERKRVEIGRAREEARSTKIIQELANAKAAGSGIQPDHKTAMELAFQSAKPLKGKQREKPRAVSAASVPAGEAANREAGPGQAGEPRGAQGLPGGPAARPAGDAQRVGQDGAQEGAGAVREVGTREEPVQAAAPEHVAAAAERAAELPSPAQIAAGNNKKGHFEFAEGHPLRGLGPIAIETAKGVERVHRKGEWISPKMPAHYGHLQIAEGNDGDKADITIGDDLNAKHAYVIDQINPETEKFDETKSFVGFPSEKAAVKAYLGSFSDNAKARIGAVTEMPLAQFVQRARSNNLKKAVAYEEPEQPLQVPPETHELLRTMAANSGWAERGGQLVVKNQEGRSGEQEYTRTQWLGKPEWAKAATGANMTVAQITTSVEKAIAGKALSERQRNMVEGMLADIAETKALLAADPERPNRGWQDEIVTDAGSVSAPDDWATLSDEEKDARLDSLFGPEAGPAKSAGGGEARPAQEVGPASEAPAEREPGQDDDEVAKPARPALELETQTEAALAAKAKQAEEGKVEERSAAVRDRNDAILSAPEGTAPARSVEEQKVPTQQGSLIADFGAKIGGARKDTARPGEVRVMEKDAEESAEPGWRKRFRVYEIAASADEGEKGRWAINDTRVKGWRGAMVGRTTFATKEAAEQAIPLLAVSQRHRPVPVRVGDTQAYEIWRDVTDRKRIKVVNQQFATREDAMRYMAEHAAEIMETKTGYGEEILPKPETVKRTGVARRTSPATAKMFTDTFGFRGVEFGNWNNQDERQELMDHAYDGLLDLAETLGIQAKAISLNGDLALAFGARGHGLTGARAHYEPDYGVINLTKMSGAGALAHEWFHAADHYFARQDTKAQSEKVANERGDLVYPDQGLKYTMASHGFRTTGSQVREEVRAAYTALMETMFSKAEQYVEDTQKAEKFVGGAREQLAKAIKAIRDGLLQGPEQLHYMKRNNHPASAEQLAAFDQLAERMLSGQDVETAYRPSPQSAGKKMGAPGWMAGRQTNDTLEAMSAILKAVRGRQGFNSENTGPLDGLRYLMRNYAQRIEMLKSANSGEAKTKRVPTSYAMENKKIDQGRASDYWTTEHEMAARAFSAYVEDKLATQGNTSDFLSFGSNNAQPIFRLLNIRPFPEGAERVALNTAFDKLFSTLKTKETEKGVAMFSRAAAKGPFASSIERQIAPVLAKWTNAPEVHVIASMEEAPQAMRLMDNSMRSAGATGVPEAFIYKNAVYLVADGLAPDRVYSALFHEALGHYGLRGTFGDRLDPILDEVAKSMPIRMKAKARQYGFNLADESERRQTAEEVLAEIAQTMPQLGVVKRLIAAIRQFLRDIGVKLNLSDADVVANFILPARDFVERGRAAQALEAPAFSRFGERIEQARQAGYKNLATSFVDRLDQALNPLGTLPEQDKFLVRRYEAQGQIEKADEAAKAIREALPVASTEDQQAIFDYLTTAGATPNAISDPVTRHKAEQIKADIGRIGDELVAHGLLAEESREQYRDAYLPRLYLKHLLSEQDWKALGAGKKPSDMGYLKGRKDIPEEVRKVILGEIQDPGFLAAVAIAKPMRDMALLDWLADISTNDKWVLPKSVVSFTSPLTGKTQSATPFWLKSEAARLRKQARYYPAEEAAKAESEAKAMDEAADDALEGVQGTHADYKQIPNTARYGRLRGLFVRSEIYDDLMGVQDFLPTDPGWFQNVFGYGGVGTKATQIWKGMKVAMNPPAQVRNFVSNGVLLQLSGVPLRMVPARVIQATRDILGQGRYYQIAKKYGIGASTFSTQEVYRMKTELLDLEMKTRGMGPLGRLHRLAGLVMNKASDFYQMSETIFKTAKIIDVMEREKKTEQEAVIEANKWMFDYSLVQKSLRYARSAPIGVPFATFAIKVLPRLVEVAMHHPQRFLPWVGLFYGFPMLVASMLGVDKDDLDKLKKAMPQWLQDKGHALILPYKDEQGRWQVVDLGYFVPWTNWTEFAGNLVQGEAGKAIQSAGIFGGPLTDLVIAIKTGKDPFTGRDIMAKGDTPERQAMALVNYVWDMAMPPIITDRGLLSPMGIMDSAYGGKLAQAVTGTTNKFGEPRSSLTQALLYAAGVNVNALTPEYTRATNIQTMTRGLQDVKTQMVQKLQDRSLSEPQRKEIATEYAGEIIRRTQKLQQYMKESVIAPALATAR